MRSRALLSLLATLAANTACDSSDSQISDSADGSVSSGGRGGKPSTSGNGGTSSAGGAGGNSAGGAPSAGGTGSGGIGAGGVSGSDAGRPDDAGAGGVHAVDGGTGGREDAGSGGDRADAGTVGADAGTDGAAGSPNENDGGLLREFAYVSARFNGGGVSAASLDPSSGKLDVLPNAPVAGKGAVAVGVHGTQKFVCVAGENRRLETYRIAADGSLATQPSSTAAFIEDISMVALDPRGRFVYVTTVPDFSEPTRPRLIYTYRIDPDNGDLLELLPLRIGTDTDFLAPTFVAVDPTGTFAYLSLNQVGLRGYRIDQTSGKLTELADSPFTAAVLPNAAGVFGGAIVFKPTGDFLYTAGGALNAFSINRETGKLDLVTGSPFTTEIQSDPIAPNLTIDREGKYVYATKFSGLGPTPSIYGFAIGSTGALTPVPNSPIRNVNSPYSIAIDPSGGFVLVGQDVGQVAVYSVNRSTGGFIRQVEGSPFTFGGLEPKIAFATLAPN